MKKRSREYCLLLAVLLTAVPFAAEAGVRNLWPKQFAVSCLANQSVGGANDASYRKFNMLKAFPGYDASFESEVQLPVGTTISNFALNGIGYQGGFTSAYLYRSRLDGEVEEVAAIWLGGDYGRDWYSAPVILRPRVASGYKYWVDLHVNSSAAVFGVRVSYR